MSKKKLIITITSLCLVVVAAVAAVVGVVAASTQTVRSTVSVTYRANNVKATVGVQARYQQDEEFGAQDFANRATNSTNATFLATEASKVENVNVSNQIVLGNSGATEQDVDAAWRFERYVVYRFSFKNNFAAAKESPATPAQGRSMTVRLTYTAGNTTNRNCTVLFAAQAGGSANAGTTPTVGAALAVSNNENTIGSNSAYGDDWKATPQEAITVAQAQTGYWYILIALTDPLSDGDFSVTSADAPAFVFTLETVANNDANPVPSNS